MFELFLVVNVIISIAWVGYWIKIRDTLSTEADYIFMLSFWIPIVNLIVFAIFFYEKHKINKWKIREEEFDNICVNNYNLNSLKECDSCLTIVRAYQTINNKHKEQFKFCPNCKKESTFSRKVYKEHLFAEFSENNHKTYLSKDKTEQIIKKQELNSIIKENSLNTKI